MPPTTRSPNEAEAFLHSLASSHPLLSGRDLALMYLSSSPSVLIAIIEHIIKFPTNDSVLRPALTFLTRILPFYSEELCAFGLVEALASSLVSSSHMDHIASVCDYLLAMLNRSPQPSAPFIHAVFRKTSLLPALTSSLRNNKGTPPPSPKALLDCLSALPTTPSESRPLRPTNSTTSSSSSSSATSSSTRTTPAPPTTSTTSSQYHHTSTAKKTLLTASGKVTDEVLIALNVLDYHIMECTQADMDPEVPGVLAHALNVFSPYPETWTSILTSLQTLVDRNDPSALSFVSACMAVLGRTALPDVVCALALCALLTIADSDTLIEDMRQNKDAHLARVIGIRDATGAGSRRAPVRAACWALTLRLDPSSRDSAIGHIRALLTADVEGFFLSGSAGFSILETVIVPFFLARAVAWAKCNVAETLPTPNSNYIALVKLFNALSTMDAGISKTMLAMPNVSEKDMQHGLAVFRFGYMATCSLIAQVLACHKITYEMFESVIKDQRTLTLLTTGLLLLPKCAQHIVAVFTAMLGMPGLAGAAAVIVLQPELERLQAAANDPNIDASTRGELVAITGTVRTRLTQSSGTPEDVREIVRLLRDPCLSYATACVRSALLVLQLPKHKNPALAHDLYAALRTLLQAAKESRLPAREPAPGGFSLTMRAIESVYATSTKGDARAALTAEDATTLRKCALQFPDDTAVMTTYAQVYGALAKLQLTFTMPSVDLLTPLLDGMKKLKGTVLTEGLDALVTALQLRRSLGKSMGGRETKIFTMDVEKRIIALAIEAASLFDAHPKVSTSIVLVVGALNDTGEAARDITSRDQSKRVLKHLGYVVTQQVNPDTLMGVLVGTQLLEKFVVATTHPAASVFILKTFIEMVDLHFNVDALAPWLAHFASVLPVNLTPDALRFFGQFDLTPLLEELLNSPHRDHALIAGQLGAMWLTVPENCITFTQSRRADVALAALDRYATDKDVFPGLVIILSTWAYQDVAGTRYCVEKDVIGRCVTYLTAAPADERTYQAFAYQLACYSAHGISHSEMKTSVEKVTRVFVRCERFHNVLLFPKDKRDTVDVAKEYLKL